MPFFDAELGNDADEPPQAANDSATSSVNSAALRTVQRASDRMYLIGAASYPTPGIYSESRKLRREGGLRRTHRTAHIVSGVDQVRAEPFDHQFAVELQDLANPVAELVLIRQHQDVNSGEHIEHDEMQIWDQAEALRPIGAECVLAVQHTVRPRHDPRCDW